MTRHESREAAFQVAFSKSINLNELAEIYETLDETGPELDDFARELLGNTFEHIKEIYPVIEKNLVGWTLSRIPKVSLAILRISTAQLLYMSEEVPDSVVINEAVELAKSFGGDNEYSFVNGALRGILGSIRTDATGDGQ